jgi:hypothetical protein
MFYPSLLSFFSIHLYPVGKNCSQIKKSVKKCLIHGMLSIACKFNTKDFKWILARRTPNIAKFEMINQCMKRKVYHMFSNK